MAKTKLTNAEKDLLKEKFFVIMRDALNATGEDCELATSFGKNTLVMNMPYVMDGIEGVFEIMMVDKTDASLDYMYERERLQTLKADRAEKARQAAENAKKKQEEVAAKRAEKAKAKNT